MSYTPLNLTHMGMFEDYFGNGGLIPKRDIPATKEKIMTSTPVRLTTREQWVYLALNGGKKVNGEEGYPYFIFKEPTEEKADAMILRGRLREYKMKMTMSDVDIVGQPVAVVAMFFTGPAFDFDPGARMFVDKFTDIYQIPELRRMNSKQFYHVFQLVNHSKGDPPLYNDNIIRQLTLFFFKEMGLEHLIVVEKSDMSWKDGPEALDARLKAEEEIDRMMVIMIDDFEEGVVDQDVDEDTKTTKAELDSEDGLKALNTIVEVEEVTTPKTSNNTDPNPINSTPKIIETITVSELEPPTINTPQFTEGELTTIPQPPTNINNTPTTPSTTQPISNTDLSPISHTPTTIQALTTACLALHLDMETQQNGLSFPKGASRAVSDAGTITPIWPGSEEVGDGVGSENSETPSLAEFSKQALLDEGGLRACW